MKTLQVATFAILVLGLVSTNTFFNTNKGMTFYLLLPYLIMIGIALYRNYKYPTVASHISLFIAASFICCLMAWEYYNAIYHPGSSTAGLIFLVMPFFSVALYFGVYAIASALLGIKQQKFEVSIISLSSFKSGLLLLGAAGSLLMYRSCKFEKVRKDTHNEGRDFTYGDITNAKRLGLFVKDLHYKVDSFSEQINFHPYIEKGFKYGDDSTEIDSLKDTDYPYTVSFQRKAVKDAVVVINKEPTYQLRYGGQYLLKKPELEDTVYLQIKRSGVVLGLIKVFD